jgi:hypothetical protein
LEGGEAMMAKRIGKDEISEELLARIKSTPRAGISHDIIDNAFWHDDHLSPTSADWAWLEALDRLDRHGDARPLGQLLKSCKPSPRIERYIDDFIQRNLARGTGRRKNPDYTLSQNDALLMIAAENVRAYVQRGDSVDDALNKVRDEWAWVPLNKTTLAAAYNGNHASLNRHRKRL